MLAIFPPLLTFDVTMQAKKLACKGFRAPYSNFDAFFAIKTAARKRSKKTLIFASQCYNITFFPFVNNMFPKNGSIFVNFC